MNKPKYKGNVYKKCNWCNKRRKPLDESHKICRICYRLYKPSGSELVDDFIRNSQINSGLMVNMIEFVLYYQFKDIEYIAKFESYKATWIEGNIQSWRRILKGKAPCKLFLKDLIILSI